MRTFGKPLAMKFWLVKLSKVLGDPWDGGRLNDGLHPVRRSLGRTLARLNYAMSRSR